MLMALNTPPLHPEFRWNEQVYTKESLVALAEKYRQSNDDYLQHIGLFFQDWLNDSPLIEVQTSGSTGRPKRITVQKQRMINRDRKSTRLNSSHVSISY